jgi:hypothetical protein
MKHTAQIKKLTSTVNLTYDIFKNSVAKINVFYSDIYYTKISESPTYQPFDLLGLLGNDLNLKKYSIYIYINFMYIQRWSIGTFYWVTYNFFNFS